MQVVTRVSLLALFAFAAKVLVRRARGESQPLPAGHNTTCNQFYNPARQTSTTPIRCIPSRGNIATHAAQYRAYSFNIGNARSTNVKISTGKKLYEFVDQRFSQTMQHVAFDTASAHILLSKFRRCAPCTRCKNHPQKSEISGHRRNFSQKTWRWRNSACRSCSWCPIETVLLAKVPHSISEYNDISFIRLTLNCTSPA